MTVVVASLAVLTWLWGFLNFTIKHCRGLRCTQSLASLGRDAACGSQGPDLNIRAIKSRSITSDLRPFARVRASLRPAGATRRTVLSNASSRDVSSSALLAHRDRGIFICIATFASVDASPDARPYPHRRNRNAAGHPRSRIVFPSAAAYLSEVTAASRYASIGVFHTHPRGDVGPIGRALEREHRRAQAISIHTRRNRGRMFPRCDRPERRLWPGGTWRRKCALRAPPP